MGYKVGMTHISRTVNRPVSYTHNKDIAEVVTLIETPPMTIVGVVGYKSTGKGLTKLGNVWAKHLGQDFLKRVCRSQKQEQLKIAFKT
jgi:large subunit ribosomal protein L3e